MGKASFEGNSLNSILSKSKVIAETFAESAGVIGDIQGRAKCEFDSIMSELGLVADFVLSKISRVQNLHADCGKKIEKTERRVEPNDDSESNDDKKMLAEMQQAYGELESAVHSLQDVHSRLERLSSTLSSAKSKFESMRTRNISEMQRAEDNGNAFFGAVENATNRALEIENFKGTALSPQWHGGIKIVRSGHDGSAKRNFTSHKSVGKASDPALIIKSATPSEFFASVDESNADEIKIPSYNYHKLGGTGLLKELESRGYVVKKTGESIIGSDGYITWEMKL